MRMMDANLAQGAQWGCVLRHAWAVFAIGFGAMGVNAQCVFRNFKTALFGYALLAALYFVVVEFFNHTAAQAYQMVVVLALIELVHRLIAFKIATQQNASLLELGENAVHRSQADIAVILQQNAEYILG
jgi:hypothetical protein